MINLLEQLNTSDVEFKHAANNFKEQLENIDGTEFINSQVREKFQQISSLLVEAEDIGHSDLFLASRKFSEASELASEILNGHRAALSLKKQKEFEDFINRLKAREAVDSAFHLLSQATPLYEGKNDHKLNITKTGISKTVEFFEALSQIAANCWEFTSSKFRVTLEALIYETDEDKRNLASTNIFTSLFINVRELIQFIENSNPSSEDRELISLVKEAQKHLISSIRNAVRRLKNKSVQPQDIETTIARLNSLKANNEEEAQEQRETLEFLQNTISQ